MSINSNPGPIVISQQCEAITAKGRRCKQRTKRGVMCHIHLSQKEHLRVKESTIPNGGLGLFTEKHLTRGNDVAEYTGEKVVNPDSQWLSNYAVQIKKNPPTYIDAKKTNTAVGRFANNAPRGEQNNSQFVYDARGRKLHIRATKPIPKNSEITVAYGRDFWKWRR